MVFYLPIRRSRWLYAINVVQCSCALLALLHVDLPLLVRALVMLAIACFGWRLSPPPQALMFNKQGLQLIDKDKSLPARLDAQCYCSEYLIALCILVERDSHAQHRLWRIWSRRRWLLLFPDSSSADALRRLRVFLRWHAQASTF